MPGLNKTGPLGLGSMTGRRMGKCSNFGANKKNQILDENKETADVVTEKVELTKQNPDNVAGRGFGSRRGRGNSGRGNRHQNRFNGEF
jgi:hypothetical protein